MEVVDTGSLAVQRVWAPVNATDTYRVGALVGWESGAFDGVVMAGAAEAGPAVTTQICGIIEGVDTLEPLHSNSSTAVGDYVAGVVAIADQNARSIQPSSDRGQIAPMSDKAVYVKIALLTPFTKVRVPLFNAAFGTAPTVQTVTTAGTTGFIANECVMGSGDFTPIANEATLYCRSGKNKGVMRVTDATSDTQPTCDQGFPSATVDVGDTFVMAPCRNFGVSYLQTDAEGLYFDTAGSASTGSHWIFNVLELNLEKAGEENVVGWFGIGHFDAVANTT